MKHEIFLGLKTTGMMENTGWIDPLGFCSVRLKNKIPLALQDRIAMEGSVNATDAVITIGLIFLALSLFR